MFTRPIWFALLLNCTLATLTCCDVRGAIIAGDDYVPGSSALFTMTINPAFGGTGVPQTIPLLSGPFLIHRQMQAGTTINTEIDNLTFTGSSSFGPLTVRVGDANVNGVVQAGPTLGRITQVATTGAGTSASDFVFGNSVFDVLFEVDVAGMTLYNHPLDPHHLSLPAITSLPPIGREHFPFGSPLFVNLFLRTGTGTDPIVGQASGSHLLLPFDPTVPEPSTLALGIGGLIGYRRRSNNRQPINGRRNSRKVA